MSASPFPQMYSYGLANGSFLQQIAGILVVDSNTGERFAAKYFHPNLKNLTDQVILEKEIQARSKKLNSKQEGRPLNLTLVFKFKNLNPNQI